MQKPTKSALAKAINKKVAAEIPEVILITQVLYLCPPAKKTYRKKMRFKEEVWVQDILANLMLLREVTYFEEWYRTSFEIIQNISTMFNHSMVHMLLFLMDIEIAHQPKIMNIVEGWWRLLFHQMYVWMLIATLAQHLRKPFLSNTRN